MESSYTYHLTPEDAKTATRPLVAESVAAVVKELNSPYGDFMSASKPYKNIFSLTTQPAAYDAARHDVCAYLEVTSDNQSPYGDNANVTATFYISRTEAERIAAEAPDNFRTRMQMIAGDLGKAFDQARRRAAQEMKQMLRTGYGEELSAPPRAAFIRRGVTR